MDTEKNIDWHLVVESFTQIDNSLKKIGLHDEFFPGELELQNKILKACFHVLDRYMQLKGISPDTEAELKA